MVTSLAKLRPGQTGFQRERERERENGRADVARGSRHHYSIISRTAAFFFDVILLFLLSRSVHASSNRSMPPLKESENLSYKISREFSSQARTLDKDR